MDISFVINSYGRKFEEIQKSFESCLKQVSDFTFEIIFIDQNKIPVSMADPSIIHIHYPETSISKARNRGAINASGEWLIFVDDDAELDPTYLAQFSRLQKQTPSCAVWAGTIFLTSNHQLFYSQRQNISHLELGFLDMKVLMGGNFIIKRDLFAGIGRFDENFGIGSKYPSSEDTDLAWRLHYAGFPIRLSHDLKIYHPAPQSIGMKKAFSYGLGKGALVGKWLFKQHKFATLIEFAEMIIVPFFKMIIDIKASPIHFATLVGRVKGFIRYAF